MECIVLQRFLVYISLIEALFGDSPTEVGKWYGVVNARKRSWRQLGEESEQLSTTLRAVSKLHQVGSAPQLQKGRVAATLSFIPPISPKHQLYNQTCPQPRPSPPKRPTPKSKRPKTSGTRSEAIPRSRKRQLTK